MSIIVVGAGDIGTPCIDIAIRSGNEAVVEHAGYLTAFVLSVLSRGLR